MRTFFLLALFSCFLASCAIRPSQEEMASADYGDYPKNYKEVIEDYMSMRLIDPDSVKYNYVKSPQMSYYGLGGRKYGYTVCSYVNAKNRLGGYTGNTLMFFFIRNGQVIAYKSDKDSLGAAIVSNMCK